MERRALIALALSFAVFMAFIYYGEKNKGPKAPVPLPPKPPLRRGPGPGSGSGSGRACHQAGVSGGEGASDPSGQRRGGGHALV